MSNPSGTATIDIKGVKQTVTALKAFTPEIHKALNKTIRQALATTRVAASSRYPGGAWGVRINTKRILGSVGTTGGALGSNWAESSPGVKAAIFEFAGSTQPGMTPQARAMIESLNSRYGKPGRFLWDAWDETGHVALERIRIAVKEAERELQAHLNATGEAF